MSEDHEKMVRTLKQIVVPNLRQRGFRGTFPHFRRLGQDKIDLLFFQFDLHGGGFVIEISKCPPEGFTTFFDELIPPNRVKSYHMHERLRLQPGPDGSTSSWFRYDIPRRSNDIFEKIARQVLPFLDIAEKWWSG